MNWPSSTMRERAPAYESLVTGTGLDPAVIRAIDISTIGGTRVATVRRDEKVQVPGYGAAFFVEDFDGTPILSLPKGLEHAGTRLVPLVDPGLGAAPTSPGEYWTRSAVMAAKFANLRGRVQVAGGRENGWIPIVERMVDAVCAVVGAADSVTIRLEASFGLLGVAIHAACRDPDVRTFVNDLGPWAEAIALDRCMVCGEPGWRGPVHAGEPWEYTLSDRVRALPDPLSRELLYPRPPEAE
jgi:hypothetical protein